MTAVGVNSEGKLRFVDHAPTNPEGAEYRLAAPIPAQGIAQANPNEEAITRFKEAILSAVESRSFIALYHTEGASADLVDTDIRHLESNGWADRIVTAVEFVPITAAIEEAEKNSWMEKAWKPIQRGDHLYGQSLPIAGRIKVSHKPKEGKGWSGSIDKYVGINKEGELKFALPVPVVPPNP